MRYLFLIIITLLPSCTKTNITREPDQSDEPEGRRITEQDLIPKSNVLFINPWATTQPNKGSIN